MEKKVYRLKAVTFSLLRVLMYVITDRLAASGFDWENEKQGNYYRKEEQIMEKEQNQYCILVEELLPLYQEGSLGENVSGDIYRKRNGVHKKFTQLLALAIDEC